MPICHVQHDRPVAFFDELAGNLDAVVVHRIADTGFYDRDGIHSRRILVEHARLQHFIRAGKSNFRTRRSDIAAPAADAHRLREDVAVLLLPLGYRRIVWMMVMVHSILSFVFGHMRQGTDSGSSEVNFIGIATAPFYSILRQMSNTAIFHQIQASFGSNTHA